MMDDSIHILLIEDDPAHAELIQRAFEEHGNGAHLVITDTLTKARSYLETFQPSLIIADWRLPDGDSSTLLEEFHKPIAPVIIMTSYGSERNAVEAIRSGALDYIVKSSESMMDMPHIAERAIQQWLTIQEQGRIQVTLAERESQFRLLAENSSDMISRHDTNGSFLYVSPACQVLLGYEPEELIGKEVIPFVHPEDAARILKMFRLPRWDVMISTTRLWKYRLPPVILPNENRRKWPCSALIRIYRKLMTRPSRAGSWHSTCAIVKQKDTPSA